METIKVYREPLGPGHYDTQLELAQERMIQRAELDGYALDNIRRHYPASGPRYVEAIGFLIQEGSPS